MSLFLVILLSIKPNTRRPGERMITTDASGGRDVAVALDQSALGMLGPPEVVPELCADHMIAMIFFSRRGLWVPVLNEARYRRVRAK